VTQIEHKERPTVNSAQGFPWTRWKGECADILRAGATSLPTGRGLIEYATLGDDDDPPVLVIHGTPGGYDQGLLTASRVGSGQLRFIAPSRSGYLGTALSVGKTPRDQADSYAELLDALSIRRAAIVGLSGGGPSSLQFAVHHAERCAALVLISAVTHKRPGSERPLPWRILLSSVLATDFGAWLVCKAAEAASGRSRYRLHAAREVRAYDLMTTLVPPSLRQAGLANDIEQTSALPEEVPSDISCPTLIIHGQQDRLVRRRHAERAAAAIPQSELVTAPGGHDVFFRSDELASKVARFLEVSVTATR
jgi:pimeloyl-ACP methyl ester carboxylesterase